jgi:AraC family transcriptional regulator, regulatory protein of adaptative response / methylated-DNA-[protein]-cysteine methyltransferase
MYQALCDRDPSYEGVFVAAVKSTGIFCRSTCPARKPVRKNVGFYATTAEALAAGFRPCKRCRPMEPVGEAPDWLRELLADVETDPGRRWLDADLRARQLDPVRVRRWFKNHHGMTFHAYQRARRLGRALGQLTLGDDVAGTAYRNGFESLSGFHDAVQRLAGTTPARSRATTLMHLTRIPTPLGPMVIATSNDALCMLEFADRRMLQTQLARLQKHFNAVLTPGENPITLGVHNQLQQYFAGDRRQFDLPLQMPGTDFQQQVWQQLLTIPFGQTRSYSEQAKRIGRPAAVRAVGRANGDNRIAIIVPCHRVVGADGKLTGYGGGLWRKQRLLEIEAAGGDTS